jgi:hypothetical protein
VLRVGFDGHAFSSPAAGIRRYATELVGAMVSLGEPIELVALGGDPRVFQRESSMLPNAPIPRATPAGR